MTDRAHRPARVRARRVAGAVAVAAVLSGAGACGGSDPQPPPAVKVAHFVQVDGDVLVNAKGFALYVYAPDRRRAVTCAGTCAVAWPPLYTGKATKVTGGPGTRPGLLGHDPDPVGGTVVTYDHWPLYTYAGDPQPGFAAGQGLDNDGGFWYLIRPDGQPIIPAQ